MLRRPFRSPFGVIAGTLAFTFAMSAHADDFLRLYSETRNFSLGRPVLATPSPDGRSVLFLRSAARSPEQSLYETDLASGETRELLTPHRLLAGADEQLSAAEHARRERMRLSARGFTNFMLSDDGDTVLLPLSGKLFSLARKTGAVRELPTGAGAIIDPQLSPDGKSVAFVRDRDLYILELAKKTPRRLTTSKEPRVTNGLAEFVAQEEMGRMSGYWWSPDSKQIAFEESDTRKVETFHLNDVLHPETEAEATPYPRPGGENASVRLGVVGAAGGRVVWINWDREKFPYLARVGWKDGPLTLVVESRDQRDLVMLIANPQTGKTTQLLAEHDDAWLNLDQSVPRWIGGKNFLWSSERSGSWQLELRDAKGALVRALSAPTDGYINVVGVDSAARAVWFSGAPDPTEQQLYRVSLDGGAAEARTTAPATHDAHFDPNGRFYVLRTTSLEAMPHFTAHGAPGERDLPSVAENPPAMPAPELVRGAGPNGINAMITRPRNFKAGTRYPVILDVYGGPHHQQVTRALAPLILRQWIADHGFIVVAADGRGTPRRGRAWERALLGNFAGVTIDDQVAALYALGAKYPELDLTRVGALGWSFGGYMAALAVLKRPDVFAAGVAGAPVVDWRDYDTFYTERYLGLPGPNPEAYKQSSLLTYAAGLSRPLLIIHGTRDDNVYFFHSLKLAEALFRAGRPFELLPLPGLTHMVPDPAVKEALYSRILNHLSTALKVH